MIITIVSAYTWYNKGDAAILLGTIDELNDFYKDANITFNILTFTPEIDREKYKTVYQNIENVESNIFNPYPFKRNKFSKMIAMFKMGVHYAYLKFVDFFPFFKINNTGYNLCEGSDVIVVCGGGFLGGNKYNSLTHLAQIDILKGLNKPMILWGTSIEPPSKKNLQFITEKILGNLTCILPREEITYNYLKKWYPLDRIVKTPDMAFKTGFEESTEIDELFEEIREKSDGKKIIGITMRKWNFPRSENPEKMSSRYEKALIETINKLQSSCLFVFIPQVIMDGDDDRVFAQNIQASLKSKESFWVLTEDYSPYQLKYLISLFDQFLGTRMHSNIFSATIGCAPVAIAYEKKTNGIMKNLELEDYVIDIEDVNSAKLIELLEKNSIQNETLNFITRKNVSKFITQIRKATIEVNSLIERSR